MVFAARSTRRTRKNIAWQRRLNNSVRLFLRDEQDLGVDFLG